jgi:DNA polymerase I-like protein with 3'-5' exonuclease and polymerase domains
MKRLEYYDELLKPLHPFLVDMGLRGLPTNPETRGALVKACRKAERAALEVVEEKGNMILRADRDYWQAEADRLRDEAKAKGQKLTGLKPYQSAMNKLRTRKANVEKGFALSAPGQRAALVYDYLGLPTVGREGRSTKEEVLEELILRMNRRDENDKAAPSASPIRGTLEEATEILNALVIGSKNATWRRNFLSTPLVDTPGPGWPRLQTEYHLHRTATGRLSSGTAKDDADKKEKKQQLQNVPKPLRAPVEADPGMVLVGGDWSNVEWAVVQVYSINVPDWVKQKLGIPLDFHDRLLERFLARDLDAHRYLASVVYGKPEEEITPQERQSCKAYTHGRNYKGSERGLAASAGHTVAVATRTCKAHKDAFMPHGWWWMAEEFVKNHGYIETAGGWRRWFFEMSPKPTEIMGTQIQGSAADLCKLVLLDVFRTLPTAWEVLTTTHDSILLQVPEAEEQKAAGWLTSKMEQPIPFLTTPRYPKGVCFPADVGSAKTWDKVA